MQVLGWLTSILTSDVGGLLIGLIRRSLGLQEDHEKLRDVLKRLRSLENRANAMQAKISKLDLDIQGVSLGEETEYEQINNLKAQVASVQQQHLGYEADILQLRSLLTAQHELTFGKIQDIFERLDNIETKYR